MTKSEKNDLKRALLARITSPTPQLDLATNLHWVIPGVTTPIEFFAALPILMKEGSVLYVEGTTINPKVVPFYEKYRFPTPTHFAPDTLFPEPLVFHLYFTARLCELFKDLLKAYPTNDLFDHIKGYSDRDMTFTFHDAFCGILRVSHDIFEKVVTQLSERLNATHALERAKRPDLVALTRLLNVLERNAK